MGLRLLAGPFPIVGGIDLAPPENVLFILWHPGLGLVAHVRGAFVMETQFLTGNNFLSLMTLDGRYQGLQKRILDNYGWWPARQRMVGFDFSEGENIIEPKTFMYLPTGEPQFYTGTVPSGLFRYVKLPDRWLYFSVGRIRAIDLEAVDTAESAETFDFTAGAIGPGRGETDIFVTERNEFGSHGDDTRCFFYNSVTKLISSPIYHLGMTCRNLIYAPDWDVLVSLHLSEDDEFLLRVWSLEVIPTTITVPVALTEVKAGRVVPYQVKVTGDHNDVCVGELVNWQVYGVGALVQTQTKTDSRGYATASVLYGLDETGDSTVVASLTC